MDDDLEKFQLRTKPPAIDFCDFSYYKTPRLAFARS